MAQAPISTSPVQTEALDKLFRETFLASAPLYSAASKVKLPYEDLKSTTLYHGSLTDEMRVVEQIADYRLLKDGQIKDEQELTKAVQELGKNAGIAIDALIRLENGKQRDGADVRNVAATRVVDVFEHADGRRNLNFMFVTDIPVMDPAALPSGWIAYRFYFACARIRQEYKHATTKSY